MIEVKQTGHSDPLTFDVVIRESGNEVLSGQLLGTKH